MNTQGLFKTNKQKRFAINKTIELLQPHQVPKTEILQPKINGNTKISKPTINLLHTFLKI